jgi:hypothetical protein
MLARFRAVVQHDRVGVSRSRAGVEEPRCNIVHVRRPSPASERDEAASAARAWLGDDGDGQRLQARRASAVLRVQSAREDARARLVPAWLARDYPRLADAIAEDAEELARMVGAVLASGRGGADAQAAVSARLEALSWQPCPKWHADTVVARGIVTYSGNDGTQYLPNARVRRGWDAAAALTPGGGGGGGGALSYVAGVRPPAPGEPPYESAGLGDLLLLKGHACPGMEGMGAVHRSPEMLPPPPGDDGDSARASAEEEPRLVLTVDDALPCDCCPPTPPESEERIEAAAAR